MKEETKRKMSEAHKGKHLSKETRKKIGEARKGKYHSEEAKRKISEAKKGKHLTEETKRKMSEARKKNPIRYWLGISPSEEIRKKISEANKGKTSWIKGKHHSEETKKKISKACKGKLSPMKGKHPSEETRKKLSESRKGEKNHFYIDGRTPENLRIRHSLEMELWRKAVFERDYFTCQKCKQHGGNLHPHHIFNFADYPEKRTEISNGITLCEYCHLEFHKKYGFINNTAEQLKEFLN